MLASMCKLKVGRLSREVGFFSMMLMFMSYDVSDVDVHEDGVCDVDHHDFDVDLWKLHDNNSIARLQMG